MTADDIIDRVVEKIQDPSYSDADILDLINDGRYYIAGEIDLPALQTTGTVSALSSASSVALPVDYHKNIYWIGSGNQQCRIGKGHGDYYNLLTFMETWPPVAGIITQACVDGANLLYQGKDDDTLTLKYYKLPTAILIANVATAVPTEIPYHLQKTLLVSYCCKEIFAEIEDGLEGAKVNTDYWTGQFNRAMASLSQFVAKNKPREPKYVRDMGEA